LKLTGGPERLRAIGQTKDPSRISFIDDCFHLQNLIEQSGSGVEVIGNIFEHKHLLEVK